MIEWLVANRDGVIAGSLVAAGIVALMLVARMIGQRMVASEAETDAFRLAQRRRPRARQDDHLLHGHGGDRHRRDLCRAAGPNAAAGRHRLHHRLRAAGRDLGARADPRADRPARQALGKPRRRSAVRIAIIRVLVSVALFALAIVVILDNLGVNVTALVAGLGIGGIAIGLAAQGIFSDLFAALAILFDKPFRRGDIIRYDNTTGTVERIGLKTTRLRGLGGEQVVMANTKLLEREVHNVTDARVRRIWLPFGLVYQTPPDVIERLPEILKDAGGMR